MPDTNQQPARTGAPLAASAIILSFAYIAMTVSGHSDADLIRPDTQVSLEKVSLPSAWIFGPLTGVKLPVLWFYLAAPVIVLWLHFELLRRPPAAGEPWAKALRLAGNVLAPATLFLLLWKFAPYANARPDEVPGVSVARGVSRFHSATLFIDAALYLYVSLEPLGGIVGSARAHLWRRIGVLLVALGQASLLWLVAFSVASVVDAGRTQWEKLRQFFGVGDTILVAALALLICAAVWLFVIFFWHIQRTISGGAGFGRTRVPREVSTMRTYTLLFATLLVSAALPDLGRPLNLAGARLAAAEPSEAVIAAMIGAAYRDDDTELALRARQDAWHHFGRGLDYARWKFPSASFDSAVMPKIRLANADLRSADLSNAFLPEARLTGAELSATRFIGADLSKADLTCVDNPGCFTLAQAQQRPPDTQAQPRPTAATAQKDVCTQAAGGPILDGAKLAGASLTNANLSNASLVEADMAGVKDLVQTNLAYANLRDANLKGVKFKEKVILKGACLCADLEGADLTGADVQGANFRGANLVGAMLPPGLQGASFEGANIKDAKLSNGSDLRDAILDRVVQMDSKAYLEKGKCEARLRTQ